MTVVLHLAHIYQSLTMCQGAFPVKNPPAMQEMMQV